MNFWKDKTIICTGGAGSIGTVLVEELLKYPVRTVRVFDIDENGLFTFSKNHKDSRLRFLLGDVCDRERVKLALRGVDVVLHSAAVKNLGISEMNAPQCIRTNVLGTVNLVECAISLGHKPDKFMYINTDKAVEPISLYGATKFVGEKAVEWAHQVSDETKFATCRFGNVWEARGNVFETWKEQHDQGKPITLTDPDMKRYFIHIKEVCQFILTCVENMQGGEIYIPKMKECNMMKLAKQHGNNIEVIGARSGEKIREKLWTRQEETYLVEFGDMWVIDKNS